MPTETAIAEHVIPLPDPARCVAETAKAEYYRLTGNCVFSVPIGNGKIGVKLGRPEWLPDDGPVQSAHSVELLLPITIGCSYNRPRLHMMLPTIVVYSKCEERFGGVSRECDVPAWG